ncbi:hypothetical protein UFOVP45_30 [uncultured Caudovirales phage]|uniref:Uncharacterized protein n=1 Tax=uncultured Caudovirales phage TaxID=2100421 RepID=A0A6J5KN48_9CAUD|nr:hypothetical protein UFOVP45_30 [uncultured Caudovirales phage]
MLVALILPEALLPTVQGLVLRTLLPESPVEAFAAVLVEHALVAVAIPHQLPQFVMEMLVVAAQGVPTQSQGPVAKGLTT